MSELTLDMNPETVRALGYRIVDMVVSELSDPSKRSTKPPVPTADVLAKFDGPFPEKGTDPDQLLSIIEKDVIPANLHSKPFLMACRVHIPNLVCFIPALV